VKVPLFIMKEFVDYVGSKGHILDLTKCAIYSNFYKIEHQYTKKQCKGFRSKVEACNDINELNKIFEVLRYAVFDFDRTRKEREAEFKRNNKFCPNCKQYHFNIAFRYKKVFIDINGIRRTSAITDNLAPHDPCNVCYKEYLKENLLDGNSKYKILLRQQGVKNITDEMVKTKKLTLLIKKHIKDEKES